MAETTLPPLAALRAFEAAARHGSLTAAAAELNVTHAAVAQQVRKLEAWFDTPLLERVGKGVEATARGAELVAGLTSGFSLIRDTVRKFGEDLEKKPLHVTVTPTFAASWLMPRLERFRESAPDVELMINPSAEVVDMTRDDYDVGIRFGHGSWDGVEAVRIVESDICLVAAPALLQRTPIETPEDLLKVAWIQELGSDEMRYWLSSLGIDAARHTNVINLPGYLAVAAIKSAQGVGKTAYAFVADDIAAGRLVRLFPAEHEPDLGYYLIYRPGVHRPPLKAFIKWIRREIELACQSAA